MRTRVASLVVAIAGFVSLAAPARVGAEDLADLIRSLNVGIGTSDSVDCFAGLCNVTGENFSASLDDLGETNSQIVNNRIVPLSSSVSGFTYEYNEDLDIYERSTRTFGPLFSERARTLGRGRMLLGVSHSTLSFDEFEGDDISKLRISSVQGGLQTSGAAPGSLSSSTNPVFDSIVDLDIDESVTTLYYTYGLTDKIDLGIVLPVISLDISASSTQTTLSGTTQIPSCATLPAPFPRTSCLQGATGGVSHASDSYTGIGDVIVRGKWNFWAREMSAGGLFLSTTIPTGDPDNLTGLHTFTFTPGVVLSRDFETPIGGFGIQGMLGYEIRPDEGNKSEWEWGTGVAYQPFSRASFAVDILGTEEAANSEFGDRLLDLSLGAKVQLTSGLLLDLNYITPLNDEGLRSDGIYSAQLEWVFGD